jgi:hypothetical protein
MYCVLIGFIDKLFTSKYCSAKPILSEVVFGVYLYLYHVLYFLLMYHQHTLMFCRILDMIHHLQIK